MCFAWLVALHNSFKILSVTNTQQYLIFIENFGAEVTLKAELSKVVKGR